MQNNQAQIPENKPSDKELNFRAIEAKLQQERSARQEIEKENQMLRQQAQNNASRDDEDDNEPYVDNKKLDKKLNKFGQTTQSDIQKGMEIAKQAAKEEIRQEMWLENNPDFYEVLNQADKLLERAPQLAASILKMPDNFERQKLVYQNIKALDVHKAKQAESSIQQKIDANRKSPYYQPSGTGTAPYSQSADFSEQGQKQAYAKLQELKKNLRI